MSEIDRQSRIEDAIAKLTEISSDLNKMVAVHELRLTNQEKATDTIELILEKRRDEFETKINELYDSTKDSHDKLFERVINQEKMMYTYMGGFSVIAFSMAYWDKIKLFFTKL